MTDSKTTTTDREIVGLFADRASFEAAINALKDADFGHADLSLLSSHESIDAAGKPAEPWADVLTAAVGELKYEAPLVASGAIFLVGGPVAATVAGLIGAATGVIAAKEVLEGVLSTPHTEEFQRALEAGSVILWVRATGRAKEKAATDILTRSGATNVHVHEGDT
ncbi:MAG: hypothetical protein HQ504_05435 [Rhodospirillaceae bacterium]|nr:hypothetical protein [Rhodospirillaceae bacterium]